MNTTKTISPIVMLALRRYSMPQYELRHVAAEIALHTDVSIADVGQTVTTFGRVQVLFVTPYRQKDPPVLFIRGQAEALRLYYRLWRKLHNGEEDHHSASSHPGRASVHRPFDRIGFLKHSTADWMVQA